MSCALGILRGPVREVAYNFRYESVCFADVVLMDRLPPGIFPDERFEHLALLCGFVRRVEVKVRDERSGLAVEHGGSDHHAVELVLYDPSARGVWCVQMDDLPSKTGSSTSLRQDTLVLMSVRGCRSSVHESRPFPLRAHDHSPPV